MRKYEKIYHMMCDLAAARLQSGLFSMPTEEDLCRRFGVSRQTVRKALHLMKEEHLLESRQGSGSILTGVYPGGTNQIILLTESDEDYLYPLMISEMTRYFDRRHFSPAVVVTGGETQTEKAVLEQLLQNPPRGLIAWVRRSALPSPNAGLYHALSEAGTAIVFPAGKYPNVHTGETSLPDNEQGGYELTAHLIRTGHTAIAMLLLEDDISGQLKYLGYCRALSQYSLPVPDRFILKIPPLWFDLCRKDPSCSLLDSTLSKLPGETTALICQNDELAFMAIRSLEHSGIRIPADVSVAGFDASHLKNAGRHDLTTMQRFPRSEAAAACQTMMHLLSGYKVPAERDQWKLMIGSTTGKHFDSGL